MSDRIFCDKCHTLYVPGERHGCVSTEETGCSFCSNPAISFDAAKRPTCATCIDEAAKANDFKSRQDERKAFNMKKGFDVNKPHHSETQTAFKTCANNCNSYANKSIHEDDGSLTFYCEKCFPFAKRKVVAPSVSWYCVKCKRVVTTYVKDGLTKCYSCAGTTLILSDDIEKHMAKRTCIASGCSTEFVPTEEGDYRNYCPQCAAQWRDAKKHLDESNPFKKTEKSTDAVNHPSHYNSHPSGVECITVTEHFNFNIGNAIKYLWRAGLKDSMIQDLKKAKFYVEREIERLTKAEAEGGSK
jgi:hypothetical protein